MQKNELIAALEEVFEICASDDGDLDQAGQVAANVLGYEWPPDGDEDE